MEEEARPKGLERAARHATVAALAIGVVAFPIPWGSVLPGGRLVIQTVAFVALAASAFALGSGRGAGRRVPLAAIGALAALGAFQLVPLPAGLLASISPGSATTYAAANEVLGLFGREEAARRISIAPTETLQATLFVLACGALFHAASTVSSRGVRRGLGWLLVASSAAQIAWAASTQRDTERIHGTFVNPNHFAGYLQIALAVAFAFMVESILTGRDRERAADDPLDRMQKRWTPVAWRALAWGTIVIGILVTRSRGGIAAAALATLLLLVVALSMRHVRHHRAFAAAGSGAIAAGAALAFATTGRWPLLRFFTTDPRDAASDLRPAIWRLSVEAWHEFPALGSGLGTFREAFRRVQPEGLNLLVEQAHMDALQMLVTGGVAGLAIAIAGIGALAIALWRETIAGPSREGSAWSLAGLGAIVALTLHGLVEFNLSIPAIPATLAIVAGLAVGTRNAER
jgi:O-antigen ligase